MIHGLALCPGVGGLELGLELALGPAFRTVCYVEREAFVAGVLAARMQDGDLAPAPIWDDVRSFDGRPWRGRVDLISAGFPCQPFSQAGKRASTSDPRYLWDDIARVVGEVEPRVVCLENVPGLLTAEYVPGDRSTRGEVFGKVLADLASLGYVGAWRRLRAADVGARHRRDRVFVVAVAADAIDWLRDECGRASGQGGEAPAGPRTDGARVLVANADGERREQGDRSGDRSRGRAFADAGRPDVADADGERREGRTNDAPRPGQGRRSRRDGRELADADSPRRQGTERPKSSARGPGPSGGGVDDRRGHGGQWGPDGPWTVWQTEPDVGRVVDGVAAGVDLARTSRRSRLRATGNGCVPHQAAAAILSLMDVLFASEPGLYREQPDGPEDCGGVFEQRS